MSSGMLAPGNCSCAFC